jgi:hypothetical protein
MSTQKRDGEDGPRYLTDPIRTAYTREEIIREAKAWMVEQYGPVKAAGDKDAWYARLGLLVSFLTDKFPVEAGQ